MFQRRMSRNLFFLLLLPTLVAPALGSARKPPIAKSCRVYACPSAGLNFICCTTIPNCLCSSCPDYC